MKKALAQLAFNTLLKGTSQIRFRLTEVVDRIGQHTEASVFLLNQTE